MKRTLPIAFLLTVCLAGAQEQPRNKLTVGFENDYGVPDGHVQTRYADWNMKLPEGWYVGVRLQDIELFRKGNKTFDKNAIFTIGGRLTPELEFEVLGAPRFSGDRVAPWYGGELRLIAKPFVFHVGARHYDTNPDINDFRFGGEYYFQNYRIAGEVIAPDKLGLTSFRGWFDYYYDEKGSVAGIFVAGPAASTDYSTAGFQGDVLSTVFGVRVTHMIRDNFGVTGAIEVAPIRTLGFGIVVRF
jgi:hypothetical protein